ncbi:Uu.00g033260.m01.CDS01 [Anthostomella pinea]|uniref:Uu.00g033260.m01.CDS01 n=1 Tax=Anthostomella pinea TaxID=933095 RepID=A0AAI8V8W8_9PEZI|nr:Uu.00g033260.m01.CDS01 [Anthostomella pinea]
MARDDVELQTELGLALEEVRALLGGSLARYWDPTRQIWSLANGSKIVQGYPNFSSRLDEYILVLYSGRGTTNNGR